MVTGQITPIQMAVKAKPHSPVYRMHRYFARRPYSVFAELVRHYTEPRDVILDPFCGGGVTLVEGVLQGRRVIGFDINPLATFVTQKELATVDLKELKDAQEKVCDDFRPTSDRLFSTVCRGCGAPAQASWFEHSAMISCASCSKIFAVAFAEKLGIAKWKCPHCGIANHFSPKADTQFKVINVLYHCENCGRNEIAEACDADLSTDKAVSEELLEAESRGLWIPNDRIPDCNMQRESSLFKKGITNFRQLFTPRHLLSLGKLKETILQQRSNLEDWLLFAFSSTLRYTNRMVTRNPEWRGDRPLEWANPGFWLPSVHLEANVLVEYSRRCDAIVRGKSDYLSRLFPASIVPCSLSAQDVVSHEGLAFHVETHSATSLPLNSESIDAIITDPPYGSYVHYADLSNFWSVWLPEIQGLGKTIDSSEEAVISRKNFPGAKSAYDYQKILERCFSECARVLKPNGVMVLTFNNREPRAWAALLVAVTKAGFETMPNGLLYQEGIPSYRHTAQSRRAGSVVGDFILSFRKRSTQTDDEKLEGAEQTIEKELIGIADRILQRRGPLGPNELMLHLYAEFQPALQKRIRKAVSEGEDAVQELINEFDQIRIFNSERRQLLEQYFVYRDGKWSKESHDG